MYTLSGGSPTNVIGAKSSLKPVAPVVHTQGQITKLHKSLNFWDRIFG